MGCLFNRVSLRAIIAGVLIALMVMLAMSVLGIGIGATTLDAMIDFEEDPAFDPETGIVVWLAATNLLALLAGGWVADRLAGVPDSTDGVLHGLATWAVVTIISLWVFSTATGRVLNSAANAVGLGYDVIEAGVETAVPEAADAVQRQEYALEDIRESARNLAAETDDPALAPDELESETEEAEGIVESAAEDIVQSPTTAGDRIETAVDRLLDLDAPNEADRQDVVNVIVTNTSLTEDEARSAIDTWEAEYNDVEIDAEETVNRVSEDVTDAIALAAGVVFMAMAIGAIAAGIGGFLGAPDLTIMEEQHETNDD